MTQFSKAPEIFAVRLTDHGTITDPGKYVTALAQHMQNEGGELIIAEAVDIDMEGSTVKGVRTKDGLIECDNVVLAAGVWSKKLAEKLGVKVPMDPSVVITLNLSIHPLCQDLQLC